VLGSTSRKMYRGVQDNEKYGISNGIIDIQN
jgi:hypothetical protein